jgi:hypothetical protein
MKSLRSTLEDRYREISRFAMPVWWAIWLLCIALMATAYRWWPFRAACAFLLVYGVVVAKIRCPRCAKRIGFIAQLQPGGRRRRGLPLINIRCPHCHLTLDEPIAHGEHPETA